MADPQFERPQHRRRDAARERRRRLASTSWSASGFRRSTSLRRKIAIGPPPVFQGRERDIMLVSMVLGPGDRAAANRADMHQRFNVALSRARDRMYLFRSVS